MRRKERIPNILGEIGRVWVKCPNLRLGQMLLNVLHNEDMYYIEDIDLIKALNKFYEKK